MTVTNQSLHARIQRVVQWFLRGDEASFFVTSKSEVVRRDDNNNRRVVLYDAKVHAHDLGWRATAETYACFVEEAGLYQFSVISNLTDLQTALSKRLCSRYPVYLAEIVTLFKTLYTDKVFESVMSGSSVGCPDAMLTYDLSRLTDPF